MELTPFIGRKRELEQLQEEWSEKKAALLILYGRRRIGKTRLLTHTDGDIWRPCSLLGGQSNSSVDQLRSFSQALYNFAGRGNCLRRIYFWDLG